MMGHTDPMFFEYLRRAGTSFRLVDDPMVIAGVVEPLIVVGAAGLYLDDGAVFTDELVAELRENEAFLRVVTGGQGLAELQRQRRLSKEDANLLGRHLMAPDLIDFLLTAEREP